MCTGSFYRHQNPSLPRGNHQRSETSSFGAVWSPGDPTGRIPSITVSMFSRNSRPEPGWHLYFATGRWSHPVKVAALGSNGQFGNNVCVAFLRNGDQVIGLTHSDLEVTSASVVDAVLSASMPEFIVNTAAMHHVEKCEADSHWRLPRQCDRCEARG
jgi:hypothetical protein